MWCPCRCSEQCSRQSRQTRKRTARRLLCNPTASAASSRVTILDSGMGRELAVRCPEVMWSPASIREFYDVVKQIHSDNVKAGAEVITTFNYIITPLWLEAKGIKEKELEPLVRLAVQAAVDVRDEWASKGRKVRVAGCLPPLGPSYDDAEVYSYEVSVDVYSRIASCMVGSVDLYLAETISSLTVGKAVIAALNNVAPQSERWLSFTLQDEEPLLWSGETIQQATAMFRAGPLEVHALLFNCAPPEVSLRALAEIAADDFPGVVGVYPNSFETRHSYGPDAKAHAVREELTPDRFAAWAMEFRSKGAQIIGGCCGSGPEAIAAMADALCGPRSDLSQSSPLAVMSAL